MGEYILVTLEYLLRIILAGVCGGIIGYERKNRGKGAGIRTHMIVAIASSLMMVVSKYGFSDFTFGEDFRLDPSRVASQIVSGVGFLGAGMIFIQKRAVKGLTTAAGVWATSGIGMAIGSGMYSIGVLSSVLILIVQLITHKKWRFLQQPNEEYICFSVVDNPESIEYFKEYIKGLNFDVAEMKIHNAINSTVEIEISALLPNNFDTLSLLEYDNKHILSIDI